MTEYTSLKPQQADSLPIVDSRTGKIFYEKIWGDSLIQLLYGSSFTSKTVGSFLRYIAAKNPLISSLWGRYQDLPLTKKNVRPFCEEYQIDQSEFEEDIDSYSSFNDFFIRRLKQSARPIHDDPFSIIAPADARYTFLPELHRDMLFTVKGSKFDLISFFRNSALSDYFTGGSAIIARLCPVDCHRFYFPFDGEVVKPAEFIKGPLYSVSPRATSSFPWIWWNNKRAITTVYNKETSSMYAMAEIGATNCGNIVQTFQAPGHIKKGSEKGFFKLGGSAIILFFRKGTFVLDESLMNLQAKHQCEVFCRIGQKIGHMSSE